MYLQYQFPIKCADKRANIIFYCHCTLYVLSTALAASDVASQIIGNVRINSIPSNYNLLLSVVEQNAATDWLNLSAGIISDCCDFFAQSILVCTVNHAYHLFIHPNFQRSTVAGLCGIVVSV